VLATAGAVVNAATTARLGAEAPEAVAETFTATGDEGAPTCGQPLNETIALAIRKSNAAPASSDPVVPKPARYAREARTSELNRPLATKALALSRKDFRASHAHPWWMLPPMCAFTLHSFTISLTGLPT
jgi:hypothetical protein